MQRRIIAAMIGFLVGFGLALSSNAAQVNQHRFDHLGLDQGSKEYIQGREWLGEIFADLPGGIAVHFGSHSHVASPLRTIDFKLKNMGSSTANVQSACLERIEKIRDKMISMGKQVISGTCHPIVVGGESAADSNFYSGQVLFVENHLM